MLRKWLALLLAFCLLCSMALAEPAFPYSGLEIMLEGLVPLNGIMYGYSYRGVYRTDGASWKQELSLRGVMAMTASEDRLYLLTRDDDAGESFRYALCEAAQDEAGGLSEPERLCEIDWGATLESPQFAGLAVAGETVWALLRDDALGGLSWDECALYGVSLTDGGARRLAQGPLRGLAAYKDGRLLSMRTDEIVAINPQTGAVEPLAAAFDAGGLAYSAEEDVIYYRTAGGVFGLDGTLTPKQMGYLPPVNESLDAPSAAHEGRYYVVDWNSAEGFVSCAVDPNMLPGRRLRIAASYTVEEQMRDFGREHPDIAIELLNEQPVGAKNVLRDMQSEEAADIYELDMDWSGLAILRDKGYVADLSSSEAVVNAVNAMYPHLTKELWADGHVYALPIALSAAMPGYFPAALEKAGLTEQDLPASYEAMLAFIVRWEREYNDAYQEMRLFMEGSNLRKRLFEDMLMSQLLQRESQGEALTFDTPGLRGLLERLEEIRPALEEVAPFNGTEGFFYSPDAAGNTIFTDACNPLPDPYGRNDEMGVRPLPLALCEGERPIVHATMTVMLLNPYSDHLTDALELAAYVAEHLPQSFRTAVMPGENAPIESPYYQERVNSLQGGMAELSARRETADPAEYADIDAQLEEQRARLAMAEAERWMISEEDIAWYREHIAPFLAVTAAPYLSSVNAETRALRSRYLDGQIGLEQFIDEFDRMVTMKALENE